MSDIPRHVRLDPLDAGRDSSEVEAPPSYQEVEAEEAEAAAAAAATGTLGQPTSRQKPQPPSSRTTTTTSSSSSGRLPESHRQYHQHYRSLFSAPAPPSNAQHYSSLLPPVTSAAELSPGIPPNYDVVTSSIPDRFSCRRRAPGILPEGERDIDKERARIQAEKGRRRWGRARSPPKPEGVPLEEVCDRFGNRRREIRPPSTRDMVLNPPSIRRALGNVRISYQGASGAGV